MEVTIEKFAAPGGGIAKVDGMVVFVENTCPGDVVRIEITKKNKNHAFGRVVEIIKPSPHRVEPKCALQKVCGACQMQFIDYDYQLKLKKQIVEDALGVNVNDVVPSPQIWEYRHKIQYPVSQGNGSKRIGYYKSGTHEVVNIKHCPVQPEICDRIIDFIRGLDISGYNEKTHTGVLRHVVIRVGSGKCLVTLVVNAIKIAHQVRDDMKAIYDEFEEVSGVCVNFNPKKTNVILGDKTECLVGVDFVEEGRFKIGAKTFFQVNPRSAENIFEYVRNEIAAHAKRARNDVVVLDAYAGISAFGASIADVCERVVSVEENTEACERARALKIPNLEIHNMDVTEFFKKEKCKFDIVIIDPPRKGCTKEALDEIKRLLKPDGKIIYVSCNPATLARDIKYLGAKIESVQPFDLFCHTYHVETVAVIRL